MAPCLRDFFSSTFVHVCFCTRLIIRGKKGKKEGRTGLHLIGNNVKFPVSLLNLTVFLRPSNFRIHFWQTIRKFIWNAWNVFLFVNFAKLFQLTSSRRILSPLLLILRWFTCANMIDNEQKRSIYFQVSRHCRPGFAKAASEKYINNVYDQGP